MPCNLGHLIHPRCCRSNCAEGLLYDYRMIYRKHHRHWLQATEVTNVSRTATDHSLKSQPYAGPLKKSRGIATSYKPPHVRRRMRQRLIQYPRRYRTSFWLESFVSIQNHVTQQPQSAPAMHDFRSSKATSNSPKPVLGSHDCLPVFVLGA